MTIVEGFDRIEKKLDRMGRVKDCLNGDELLDNYDIAKLLNVSLRTVARYREKGLIRYYQTDDNGKNFYRSSEIQEFLPVSYTHLKLEILLRKSLERYTP